MGEPEFGLEDDDTVLKSIANLDLLLCFCVNLPLKDRRVSFQAQKLVDICHGNPSHSLTQSSSVQRKWKPQY